MNSTVNKLLPASTSNPSGAGVPALRPAAVGLLSIARILTTQWPLGNKLLDSLPEQDCSRVAPHLQRVHLQRGDVLHEAGGAIDFVYFPAGAIVSHLSVLEDGRTAEIAIVGGEGVTGIPFVIGGATSLSRTLVEQSGIAYRLGAAPLKDEFARAGSVQQLLLRYTQSLLTQMAMTAVCNRHHSVEQQLCRRLLMTLDHLPSAKILITQELTAQALGVRRESVTAAAGKLQRAGLIRYGRGQVTVLDRPGVRSRSCECYAVVKCVSDSLLAAPTGRVNRPAAIGRPLAAHLQPTSGCSAATVLRGGPTGTANAANAASA